MHKFKISKMNCMSCVHNITDSLQEYDQSIKVSGDVKNKIVTVESQEPAGKIKKLIEDSGYPVDEVLFSDK